MDDFNNIFFFLHLIRGTSRKLVSFETTTTNEKYIFLLYRKIVCHRFPMTFPPLFRYARHNGTQ